MPDRIEHVNIVSANELNRLSCNATLDFDRPAERIRISGWWIDCNCHKLLCIDRVAGRNIHIIASRQNKIASEDGSGLGCLATEERDDPTHPEVVVARGIIANSKIYIWTSAAIRASDIVNKQFIGRFRNANRPIGMRDQEATGRDWY